MKCKQALAHVHIGTERVSRIEKFAQALKDNSERDSDAYLQQSIRWGPHIINGSEQEVKDSITLSLQTLAQIRHSLTPEQLLLQATTYQQ